MADKMAPHWGHDPDVCRVCLGMPLMHSGGCDHCGNTGKEPHTALPLTQKQKIVAFPADVSTTIMCLCRKLDIPTGDTRPCPICDGARRISEERLHQVYDLVLRHGYELMHEATPELMPMAVALELSKYGAYTEWRDFRFYVETVPNAPLNAPSLVVAYAQDRSRPVSYEARMILSKPAPLRELPTDWPGCRLPAFTAPIWTPLPKRAAAQWNGGAA